VVRYWAKVDIGDMKEGCRIERSATEVDPVESIFQSSSLLLSNSLIHHLFISTSAKKRGEKGDAMRPHSYDKTDIGRTQYSDRR
jgi:hypothetical protein